jgi:hypothetical protein
MDTVSAAIYNPHSKPIEELPFIYGFNNGGTPGLLHGVLLAADGTCLGGHGCSHEGYMLGDLGILEGYRPDRHERFRKHYPDGYRMAFVSYKDVEKHEGLMAAIAANKAEGVVAGEEQVRAVSGEPASDSPIQADTGRR